MKKRAILFFGIPINLMVIISMITVSFKIISSESVFFVAGILGICLSLWLGYESALKWWSFLVQIFPKLRSDPSEKVYVK